MTRERFAFGDNWRRFLDVLDDERIAQAERSLEEWLGDDALAGRSFLDAGCGSGLFSLAATRPGATALAGRAAHTRAASPLHAAWTRYKSARGMSRHYGLLDWVGGLPFCGGGLGCNEFLLVRCP